VTLHIASVGQAFPPNYYDQETLIAALEGIWALRPREVHRLRSIHRHALVEGRYLALPLEAYAELTSFTAANKAFVEHATTLGAEALIDALDRARMVPRDIDHLVFVSVTGIATPSIDARLVNRLGLRADVKRTPMFGLGCVAGAVGVSRAADYLRAFPNQVVALVSVELCSLTLQHGDFSATNIVASGLFGDGAAAAIMVGAGRPCAGPAVVATRSIFYPDTEGLMGWDVGAEGFRVVLSAEVPRLIATALGRDVDVFLADQGLTRRDIGNYVCHVGGPHILAAVEQSLGLPERGLMLSWENLRNLGNLSSASVLLVLRDTMDQGRPKPGTFGLMMAFGPGMSAELVLLRW
jgi:alkylresorcinol/alkylpyrone synthase